MKSLWFLYIIYCSDHTLYTGVTTDPKRRLREHQQGPPKGAKYFRGRRALKIVYQESFQNRSLAQKKEHAIKKLSRNEKLKLAKLI